MFNVKSNNISIYPGAVRDARIREYLPVKKIVFMSEGGLKPENPKILVGNSVIQSYVHPAPTVCRLKPGCTIILDFGIELNGGIRIVTGGNDIKTRKVKVNFGESVSEAMGTPNNDHAMHETVIDLAPMGHNEVGNTGFRFVSLSVPADTAETLEIINVLAVAIYRDIPYIGSFKCSDERLNQIWKTGAYTVHLNMQDFLYDGIKRDRLVWMGDMNPEIRVVCAVFDDCNTVETSMDFVRDHAELPSFMNTVNAYSLWWIISQYDWYMYRGNLEYLQRQHGYLAQLLRLFTGYVGPDGVEKLPEWRFLDWPSQGDPVAIHAGLQGLMAWAFTAGEKLSLALNDVDTASLCAITRRRLLTHNPDGGMSKQAGALKSIGGIADPIQINKTVLAQNPFSGLSTFFGYYMMQARALAGDYDGATEAIRRYWGGMLDIGATSFWEDFDLTWLNNAGRIDEMPVPGKKDIHADYGNFCYKGLRHSLCHGWSGGPTAWLSEHLLGIKPLEPGFKEAQVRPQLAGLEWLEGAMPTPYGPIRVKAEKGVNGIVKFDVKKPAKVILR
ncbi:MAG: alpha-L-rhamnosidase [Lentisphaerae bacterium]|nr:alpha-L-rhamnosidase [Lentisphaerota bacterium]